jgi:hypothetical protein
LAANAGRRCAFARTRRVAQPTIAHRPTATFISVDVWLFSCPASDRWRLEPAPFIFLDLVRATVFWKASRHVLFARCRASRLLAAFVVQASASLSPASKGNRAATNVGARRARSPLAADR